MAAMTYEEASALTRGEAVLSGHRTSFPAWLAACRSVFGRVEVDEDRQPAYVVLGYRFELRCRLVLAGAMPPCMLEFAVVAPGRTEDVTLAVIFVDCDGVVRTRQHLDSASRLGVYGRGEVDAEDVLARFMWAVTNRGPQLLAKSELAC